MMGLVGALLARSGFLGEEVSGVTLDRATELISPQQRLIKPSIGSRDQEPLADELGALVDAIPVLERLVEIYPNHTTGYSELAFCKIRTGRANEAIPLIERSLRLDPRGPLVYNVYGLMGFALLLLGDDRASITWNERCLTANAETPSYQRAWRYSQIACAHARNGDIRAARIALAEAVRLAPHDTVRVTIPKCWNPPT